MDVVSTTACPNLRTGNLRSIESFHPMRGLVEEKTDLQGRRLRRTNNDNFRLGEFLDGVANTLAAKT